MNQISLLDFRRNADGVIRRVQQGQRLVLTYRGRPVMRLEPIASANVSADDPFYHLPEFAVAGDSPLSNEEIDQIVYGR